MFRELRPLAIALVPALLLGAGVAAAQPVKIAGLVELSGPGATAGTNFDTGVKLITDNPVDGVESIDTKKGLELCWG